MGEFRAQEAGYNGQLTSLANNKGVVGRGRQLYVNTVTVTTGGDTVLQNNVGRISAIIWNQGADTVDVQLNGIKITRLLPNQTFQIDNNFPWTGAVQVYAVSATSDIYAIEVTIP